MASGAASLIREMFDLHDNLIDQPRSNLIVVAVQRRVIIVLDEIHLKHIRHILIRAEVALILPRLA